MLVTSSGLVIIIWLHLGDVDAGHVNLLLALRIPEQYGVDSVENKLRLGRRLL